MRTRLLRWIDRLRSRFAAPRDHRRVPGASAVPPPGPPPVTVAGPAPTVRAWYEPLDGSASALVRPYLRAHEREEAHRVRQWRRDVLLVATYGVDLDVRDIHRAGAIA
ncbi:hypothetical protein [Streptomyces sp. NPDC006368]|uniref:hypothetical protein n=1 Tax=Streptomyces sp. NPDC006368 TaxID=3156760 RepID=UPI0033B5E868